MLLLLLLIVASVAHDTVSTSEDPLRAVLRSPRASLKLYSTFKEQNHLLYTGVENSQRYRLFLSSARHVADYNEDEADTGHYALNKFSAMSEAEKRAYHGLNMTQSEDEDGEEVGEEGGKLGEVESYPDQKVWTNSNSVTVVRNQGSCGSCWTFAAVGAIETRYKILSGVLRRFSEQEILDCAYDEDYDGCEGGTISRPFSWSMRNGGRLAAEKDRPYEKEDKECRASSTPDAMVAYRIKSYKSVGRGEEKHIKALQDGAVTSVLFVTDKFYSYDGNIMRDTTCKSDDRVNHGIAMVGYTPEYVLIKNSWGRDWGLDGFAKLSRNHHNCKLFTSSYYPIFRSTGVEDSGSDPATRYTDSSSPCKDTGSAAYCAKFARQGCCLSKCKMYDSASLTPVRALIAAVSCRKTCFSCGYDTDDNDDSDDSDDTSDDSESSDDSDCPGGTIRCDDGICRHEHMCQ